MEQLANTFIARTMIHAGRRSSEMKDAIATLDDLGVDAAMSKATVGKLNALASQNWAAILGEHGDSMKYKEALTSFVENKTK